MEESTDIHMETDVSSTTQDIPTEINTQPQTSLMEVTVEVADMSAEVDQPREEEQDEQIDSNTPESEKQSAKEDAKTNTEEECIVSEGRYAISNPENTVSEGVLSTSSEGDNTASTKVNDVSDSIEVVKSSPFKKDNLSPNLVNDIKTAVEISQSDISPKSPIKTNITPKTPTKHDSPLKVPNNDVASPKSPSNGSSKTPTKDNAATNTTTINKTPHTTPNKAAELGETSPKESRKLIKIIIKTPIKNRTPSKDTKVSFPVENIEIINKEVVIAVPEELPTETDSSTICQSEVTSATETNEKEHKSISRELKSLMNDAKESKIISECTQLTSKIRKSRGMDSANSSFNTSTDAAKLHGSRRESINSQKSSCSEKSDKPSLKRSMRSQNPEFVTKHKQFLNTLTNKFQRESSISSQDVTEEEITPVKKRESQSDSAPSTPKRKHIEAVPTRPGNRLLSDPYCWRCHWPIEESNKDKEKDKPQQPGLCTVCPRSFHFKCLSLPERSKLQSEKKWVCPKCLSILQAESSESRSPLMKNTSLEMLCDLLKYALKRLSELNGVEPFMNPVDRSVFPDYDKYIVRPMDLTLMKQNITAGVYGSTEAFVSDTQWILHNSIIFNTHTFTRAGSVPVQSKLTGTARALVRAARGEVGEIEACPECYAAAHARRPTWFTDVCATPHILLWAKLKGFPYWPAKGMSLNNSGMVDVRFFGAHDRAWVPARDCFLYSEKDPNGFRTKRQDILDSQMEAEQHIENLTKKFGKFVYPAFRVQFDPAKIEKQLKAMIPNLGQEATRVHVTKKDYLPSPLSAKVKSGGAEDDPSTPKDKTTSQEKSPRPKRITERKKSLGGKVLNQKKEDRKRRHSTLEEAVMTVMTPPSSKRKRLASAEIVVLEPAKSLTEISKKERSATPTSKPTTRASTPAGKQTPKIETPKENDKKSTPAKPAKSSANDKVTTDEKPKIKRDKTSKSNEPLKESPKTYSAKSHNLNKPKENKNEDTNKSSTAPKKKRPIVKEKVADDENTSLANLAKKTNECYPTITNVRSLSEPNATKSPVAGSSTSTATKTTSLVGKVGVRAFARMTSPPPEKNMPKISDKIEIEVKTEPIDYEEQARQSAKIDLLNTIQLRPVHPQKPVQTALRDIRINKVVSGPSVQTVRNPIPVQPSVNNRPRARKTFPQPQKAGDGRSELNSKNSMVYIPIQPPVTSAPVRMPARTAAPVNGPVATSPAVRPSTSSSVSTANNLVNTVATPMMTVVSMSSSMNSGGSSSSALPMGAMGALGQVGTVSQVGPLGQLPTGTVGPNSVHTVPLITSVNGQWAISLQPMMSVSGVDRPPSPVVNGVMGPSMPDISSNMSSNQPTNAPPTITNVMSLSNVNSTDSPLGDAQRLGQKPHPLDPSTQASEALPPAAAGPFTAKINSCATKMTSHFRTLLEETFAIVAQHDNPKMEIASLNVKLEHAKWRHKQEIDEHKHNHDLVIAEMRAAFEKEKNRMVMDLRRQTQTEINNIVKFIKSKQWCARCQQEARFYCCWNTAYCNYNCQRAHWPQHADSCAQHDAQNTANESIDLTEDEPMSNDGPPPLVRAPSTATFSNKSNPKNAPQTNQKKPSIIVSIEDMDGNQTVKCLGTYKPPGKNSMPSSPSLSNQSMGNEENHPNKVMSTGGFLIVSGSTSKSSPML